MNADHMESSHVSGRVKTFVPLPASLDGKVGAKRACRLLSTLSLGLWTHSTVQSSLFSGAELVGSKGGSVTGSVNVLAYAARAPKPTSDKSCVGSGHGAGLSASVCGYEQTRFDTAHRRQSGRTSSHCYQLDESAIVYLLPLFATSTAPVSRANDFTPFP